MKSVLQGGWLLTVAFGNVIVLIVAEGAGLEQVWHHGILWKTRKEVMRQSVMFDGDRSCFAMHLSTTHLAGFHCAAVGR